MVQLICSANPVHMKEKVYASVERVHWHLPCSLRGLGYPKEGWFTEIRWGGSHHAMVRENGEVLRDAGAIGSPL